MPLDMSAVVTEQTAPAKLRRVLGLKELVLYGIVLIQPTAPMPLFGVVSKEASGHVVTTILIGMMAMLFTAFSYGRMARAYPSAGSAYTYVGRELHPACGYLTGWAMIFDYVLNPIICVIWCSKAAMNFLPQIHYPVWAVFFALLFTGLNLRGIQASARTNEWMAAGLGIVIVLFFAAAIRYLWTAPDLTMRSFAWPFYDPSAFSWSALSTGTSIAVLTYIGFDGISTLSEEVENPRRNVLLATVIVCVVTGVLSSLEVYGAQLVWGAAPFPPDKVESAFPIVAMKAGGQMLFVLLNLTILVANIGSGMAAQMAAARLLYGMGRGDALPKSFFGAIEPKRRIPQNNVLLIGVIALAGAFLLSYERGAELLNFGAFIAFMGVNAAAFVRYYVRERQGISNLFVPVLGFVICAFIWWYLSTPAKVVGAIWLAVGVIYGAIRTKGFRSDLVQFEVPAEE